MSVQIEGHACSLFADRDRLILMKLSFRGKVRWFDLRIRKRLIRPLDVLKPRRLRKSYEDISFLLVFGSVLFNGVEALGSFYAGKNGSQRTFEDFVRDFMDVAYRPHVQLLRDDFRNGLAHGLAIKNGGFEFLPKGLHANPDPAGGVQIDPDMLLRNFKQAVRAYLKQLRSAGPASLIGGNFLKRFHQVFKV